MAAVAVPRSAMVMMLCCGVGWVWTHYHRCPETCIKDRPERDRRTDEQVR